MKNVPVVVVAAFLVALGFTTSLGAQAPASVLGRIDDATRAALPGVAVTIRNTATGQVENTVTAGDGTYSFSGLAAGTYEVEAVLAGFSTFRQSVALATGEAKTLDMVLRLGGLADEVTVTATRREQSMQEVPISIAAYDSVALEDLNVLSSADIVKFTPNLVFATTAGEGQKANVVVRGVGLNVSDELLESNVGVYIDDVYVASTSAFTFDLFDMERVEVLRGPQGTLFGNTATGGLIHHISRQPTATPEGYVNLRTGSYGQFRLEAAAGGPIGSKLKARVAGVFNRNDGWFENTYVPTDQSIKVRDNNQTKASAMRALLLWQPTGSLDVSFRGRWSENDPQVGPTFKPIVGYIPTTGPNAGLGIALPPDVPNPFGACTGCDRAGNPNSIKDGDNNAGARNQFGDLYVKSVGGGVKVDWRFGRSTLTSITDYAEVRKFFAEDSDGGSKQSVNQWSDTAPDQFQQEVRLQGAAGRMLWSTGLFYLHRNMKSDFAVDFRGADFAGPPWLQITRYDRESDNVSAFGRVEFALTDPLTVSPGARWYREEVDNLSWRDRYFTNGSYVKDQVSAGVKAFSDVTWKVELNYQPHKGSLFYVSAAKGVRPGFFNANVPTATEPIVKEEKLFAYEGGAKLDFNARSRLNVTGYYYDYKDMQTRAFLGFESFFLNKDARIYGAEIEASVNPVGTLFLYATTGLLHGRILDVQNGVTRAIRDTKVPNAPDFSMSGQAKYTWSVPGGALQASANIAYRTDTYSELENNPVQLVPAYTVVGARFGYASTAGWEVGVQADNLFDEQYYSFIGFVTSINTAQRFPGRPRWVSVYFNYPFGK